MHCVGKQKVLKAAVSENKRQVRAAELNDDIILSSGFPVSFIL